MAILSVGVKLGICGINLAKTPKTINPTTTIQFLFELITDFLNSNTIYDDEYSGKVNKNINIIL